MLKLCAVALAAAFALMLGVASGGTSRALAEDNRANCEAIRGTDYLSVEERAWFLTYCVGVRASAPAPAPVAVVVVQAPPVQVQPQARATAPSVSITCTSSIATATVGPVSQQVPLSAFAGEPIPCVATVSGAYTSIDWDAASIDGSGPTFTARFDLSRTPWSIRVQVNWGGNPLIKYISVSTVGGYFGCVPGLYQFCVVP